MDSIRSDRVTLLSGNRERCRAFLSGLCREKGAVHCFPEDDADPQLSAMDNIIMRTDSPNKGSILRAVRSAGLPANTLAGELSLSDRRKIVLLSALFSFHDILLMEEPLALVEDHREYLQGLVAQMTEGRCAVILSADDMGINSPDHLVL